MKRYIDLVKNESLKLWAQTGWRVLMIILAFLLVLTPLWNYLLRVLFGGEFFTENYEDYLKQAQSAREVGDELEARRCETEYEAGKYFADLGLDGSTAEYSVYYYEYRDLLLAQSTFCILAEGEYTAEELYSEYYSSINTVYYYLVDYGFYDDADEYGYYQYNILKIAEKALDDRSAEEWVTAIEVELESLRFNIENFSMKFYYGQLIDEADAMIASYTEESEKMPEITDSSTEETASYYKALRVYYDDVISCCNSYKMGVRFLLDNDIEFASWQYNTVMNLSGSALSSCEYEYPITERDAQEYYYHYSAEEYNESARKNRLLSLESQEYALYSLENSIPLPAALPEASAKTEILSQFRSVMGMVSILFICYGGIAMAQEYSSGTIRLLLIKPRSRRKIFSSKLVCLAFWWIVSAAASMVVLFVINVALLGFSDVFVPDLDATGSGISEIPSFLGALGVFGEEFLMAMLYVTFALFFAVITKKAVLSVLFPILVSIGASVIQSLSLAFYEEGAVFIAYTPFFYLDFEPFHVKSHEMFMTGSGFNDIFGTAFMSSPDIILGKHASIPLGIALISIIVVIFDFAATSVFRKQKI